MKVTSDACLFGAWIDLTSATRILDIGTGTGLLALMAAQRQNAIIDAVEIDASAACQAGRNFAQSPWNKRLHIFQMPAQRYVAESQTFNVYDRVICNPPFYSNSLSSRSPDRRIAWHDETLNLADVLDCVERTLKPDGKAHLLIPFQERARLDDLLNPSDLTVSACCATRPFSDRDPRRLMITLSFHPGSPVESDLVVYDAPQIFSAESKALLRPFFLKL